MRRQILFLDFDGVLHPQVAFVAERFCRLPLLEAWLRARPEIQVVISSSWRLGQSMEELRSNFSVDIQPRVISTTQAGEDSGGSREHQIRLWLLHEAPRAKWIAIDDSEWLFNSTERLVLCDSIRGLTAAELLEADRLLALPAETEPPTTTRADRPPDTRPWPNPPAFNTLDELERWLIDNWPPEST